MTFLHNLLKEMGGVTCAAAIGGGAHGGTLNTGGVIRRDKTTSKKRKKKIIDSYRMNPETIKMPKTNYNWRIIGEVMDSALKGQGEESTFDPSDVMSKLKQAEKQVEYEDDTIPFGLEDEDGKTVKVYVRAEQADEFESALAAMLSGEEADEDDNEMLNNIEIAEVLFKLKDKFDIVDVEWPEIEGDEEEEQEVAGVEGDMDAGGEMGAESGAEGEMPGAEGEMGAEGDMEGMEGMEGDGDMEAAGGAESALQQVIDMMKADAEARKAESEARAEEAKARTAEAHASAAASKVSQEEQVLDAEAHEKQKKAEKSETERLAKMAKYRHDQAQGAEASIAAAEDEESNANPGDIERLERIRDINQGKTESPISVQSLADELIKRLRGASR